ncbi:MAG: hypothetical protein H7A37_02120 [Chlamydiales bacterium]|nr:hypothetical protein [Chlamydiales bacterium]
MNISGDNFSFRGLFFRKPSDSPEDYTTKLHMNKQFRAVTEMLLSSGEIAMEQSQRVEAIQQSGTQYALENQVEVIKQGVSDIQKDLEKISSDELLTNSKSRLERLGKEIEAKNSGGLFDNVLNDVKMTIKTIEEKKKSLSKNQQSNFESTKPDPGIFGQRLFKCKMKLSPDYKQELLEALLDIKDDNDVHLLVNGQRYRICADAVKDLWRQSLKYDGKTYSGETIEIDRTLPEESQKQDFLVKVILDLEEKGLDHDEIEKVLNLATQAQPAMLLREYTTRTGRAAFPIDDSSWSFDVKKEKGIITATVTFPFRGLNIQDPVDLETGEKKYLTEGVIKIKYSNLMEKHDSSAPIAIFNENKYRS